MSNYKVILAFVFCVFFFNYAFTQESNLSISDSEKAKTVESVTSIINRNYIFPEVSNKIVSLLHSKLKKGEYSTIKSYSGFASALTKDIQSFNHDRHLRVLFEPERIAREGLAVSAEDSIRFAQDYTASLKNNNYFFKQVSILEGNIGYLDFRRFISPEHAAETAIAAMNMLSNTDAIIVDLRNNGGGSPEMVQLISSYFFGNESVHLNSIYNRRNESNKQYWTLPYVSGKKNPKAQLYIITSKKTFSAAEEFAYNLKHLNRAMVIGENTAGGAHSGGRIKATEKYYVWIPMGRSINPITNSNWEGVGVEPHIKVPEKDALIEAHIKALDSLKSISAGNKKREKFYEWHLKAIKAKKNPLSIPVSTLKAYTGNFGIHAVYIENDNLCIQRKNSQKHKLIPINENTFMFDESPDFRFQFLTKANKTITLKILNINGSSSEHKIN